MYLAGENSNENSLDDENFFMEFKQRKKLGSKNGKLF